MPWIEVVAESRNDSDLPLIGSLCERRIKASMRSGGL